MPYGMQDLTPTDETFPDLSGNPDFSVIPLIENNSGFFLKFHHWTPKRKILQTDFSEI